MRVKLLPLVVVAHEVLLVCEAHSQALTGIAATVGGGGSSYEVIIMMLVIKHLVVVVVAVLV
jgi:hypothetical protein